MTNDTIKSLSYLKKSLKMSKRAIEKNQKDDTTTDANVADFTDGVNKLLELIDKWEAFTIIQSCAFVTAPVTPVTPVVPAPAPINDTDDDLLVNP